MACFIVPGAEAVAVKVVQKLEEKKENRAAESGGDFNRESSIPFSVKLSWLCHLLTGGALLLLFEHIWHGEVVPWFPFLSAMSDRADMMEMFHEMATVGVVMALVITAVWFGICVVAEAIAKRPEKAPVTVESRDEQDPNSKV